MSIQKTKTRTWSLWNVSDFEKVSHVSIQYQNFIGNTGVLCVQKLIHTNHLINWLWISWVISHYFIRAASQTIQLINYLSTQLLFRFSNATWKNSFHNFTASTSYPRGTRLRQKKKKVINHGHKNVTAMKQTSNKPVNITPPQHMQSKHQNRSICDTIRWLM